MSDVPRFIPTIDTPPVAYGAYTYLLAGWTLEEAAAFLAVDVAALEPWFEDAE